MRLASPSGLPGEAIHPPMFFLKKPVFAGLLILASGVLAYSNSFQVPFTFDDHSSIVGNAVLRNLGNYLASATGYQQYPMRFVCYLTFALNHRLGGLDVTGYHVVNLAIHLANALLAYTLVLLVFRTPRMAGSRLAPKAGTVALLCGLLFVVHPVQTQAVTYIVQRLTSLATLFYLLAVVLYAAGRPRMEEGGDWKRGLPWLAGSALSAVLAMKTKEFAFTLPLAVSLYEASFFRGAWKRRFLYLLPVLLTLPIVPLGVLAAGKPAGELLSDVSEQMRMQTDISRPDYLFTQFRVIVTYLRLLVVPIGQNLDYDYPVLSAFFTPPVLLSFLLLAALLLLALYLYGITAEAPGPRSSSFPVAPLPSRAADPAVRLIGFGILWFFLALSVESSLVPIADVIFEHRVYLPSVGAFAAFATACVLAFDRPPLGAFGKVAAVAAALVVLGLGVGTYKRNAVWGDSVGFWEDVVRKSPGKVRPRNNLGMALNDRDQTDAAIVRLWEALKIDPNSAEAHTNLGLSYLKKNMLDAAVMELQFALTINPEMSSARLNLGAALYDRGEVDAAIRHYTLALKSDPDNEMLHNNLGVAYFRKGMVDEAIAHLRKAIALKSDYPDAHYNLGIAYGGKGWVPQAQEEMTLGLKLKKMQGADKR